MAIKPLPSQETLRQLLDYDPETGKLFWKERGPEFFIGRGQASRMSSWNAKFAGSEAFTSVNKYGYRHGMLLGRSVLGHRVAWKIITDTDAEVIDHINGDRQDNAQRNLRAASVSLNNRNKRLPKNNSSGAQGVSLCPWGDRWQVRIGHEGKEMYVGVFGSFDEAVQARHEAEVRLGYHKNHGKAPKNSHAAPSTDKRCVSKAPA